MELIQKIWEWFRNRYLNYFSSHYRYAIVEEPPNRIPKKRVLIVVEGTEADSLILKCPCGCKAVIFLNLLTDTTPRWSYSISDGRISLYPSIWRKVGCKSHFYIRDGKVVWY